MNPLNLICSSRSGGGLRCWHGILLWPRQSRKCRSLLPDRTGVEKFNLEFVRLNRGLEGSTKTASPISGKIFCETDRFDKLDTFLLLYCFLFIESFNSLSSCSDLFIWISLVLSEIHSEIFYMGILQELHFKYTHFGK